MYTVELLTNRDIKWAIEVAGKNMVTQELGRPELYNRERFLELTNIMVRDNSAFIAKKNGAPVGCIGALLSPNLFNPKFTTLAEILWYVVPAARNTRVGALLLNEYQKLCDEVADEATLCLQTTTQVNNESLQKRGWKLQETAFIYKSKRT